MDEETEIKHREDTKASLIISGLDEQSATDKAYTNILPELQKELENIYMQRLLWMKQLKKDPVHKKIMQTKDALVENNVNELFSSDGFFLYIYN